MASDSKPADGPAPFIALADYETPAMPTRDAISVFTTRVREVLRRKPAEPMIANDRLQRAALERLDEIVAPPACGPLVAELDASLAEWTKDETPQNTHRLIVMPPGDRNHVIAEWARLRGLDILAAPPRVDVLGADRHDLPVIEDSEGTGVLVIPALEDWFVRDLQGLALVRALLDRIDRLSRRVVVGCNSWAWQYLVRAVQADAILAAPLTFTPFDARRLRQWLGEIARDDTTGAIAFRDAESGDDIMSADDDEPHDVLQSLAARSRGIPWVAWRLWRRSLRRANEVDEASDDAEQREPADGPDAEDAKDAETESTIDQTLWVIALEEFLLPDTHHATTLLVLHALLIHGPLQDELLTRVVPEPGAGRLLPALIRAGIVERRENGCLACAAAAYPSIRAGLTAAGFPIAAV